MDGISQGLVANLITSGLTNVIKPKIDMISRRKLTGKNITEPDNLIQSISESALDDLHVIIGSMKGNWTKAHSEFIKEIHRTTIPSSMIIQAFHGSEDLGTKDKFTNLFMSFNENREAAEELYEILQKSIVLIVTTENFAEFTNQSLRAIRKDIKNLSFLLSQQDSHTNNDVIKKEDRDKLKEKICSKTYSNYRYLSVETDKGQKRVDLSKLFVSPMITQHTDKRSGDVSISSEYADPYSTLKYPSFKGKVNKSVIVGDPGGGKTTICQYISYDYSKRVINSIKYPDQEVDFAHHKIPVQLVLRTVFKSKSYEKYGFRKSILDEINKIIGSGGEFDKIISRFLEEGIFIIIFDGLDEIISISNRRDIVSEIEKFSNAFPLTKIIVTSRIVGYNDAPLNEDFDLFRIERLDEDGVRDYVNKFMKVVAKEKAEDAKANADLFVNQTQKNAYDLRQNPLMLGLMSWIFWQKKSIPQNRPQIYEECASLMFEKWDSRRDIKAIDNLDFDLIELFSFIAYEIFGEIEKEDGVSEKWINDKCFEFFLKWYESRPQAKERAIQVSAFICGRAWLMSKFGPDSYRFSHRTFLEYFFANELVSRYETISEIEKIISDNIDKSNWSVVSHLALQQKTWRKSNLVEEIFSTIDKKIKNKRISVKKRQSKIRFAAKTTEYLRGPERAYREYINTIIIQSMLEKNTDLLFDVVSSISEHSRDREAIVYSEVIKSIDNYILEKDYKSFNSFVVMMQDEQSLLWPEGGRRSTIRLFQSQRVGISISFDDFKANVLANAQEDFNWAISYISVYRDNLQELYKKYGYKLFAKKEYIDHALSGCSIFDSMILGHWKANKKQLNRYFPIVETRNKYLESDAFSELLAPCMENKEDFFVLGRIESVILVSFVKTMLDDEDWCSKSGIDQAELDIIRFAFISALYVEADENSIKVFHRGTGLRRKIRSLIEKGTKNPLLKRILESGEIQHHLSKLE